METYEKIRLIRELNQWSQEYMAEKLKMSPSGYAKIERGETRLNLARLEQIATVLGIDIWELMQKEKQGLVVQINDGGYHNGSGTITFYGTENTEEIARLQLIIQHKDELLEQKNQEIKALKEVLDVLKAHLSLDK
ncbi:MAG: helix-turn-helix transcriptional regulator [Conchiformibius sp.]|nr:helix-turn-helix transcriptional regulator [Conchiformibius sp.]